VDWKDHVENWHKLTMAEREIIDANYPTGSLVKHKEFWMPIYMFPTDQQFEAIRNFPLNDDDIMVASFPKSG